MSDWTLPAPVARIDLPEPMDRLLDALAAGAEDLGCHAFIVGGFVRDRLLGLEVKDLDVVADRLAGLSLAERVAAVLNVRDPVLFERFGTAQVAVDGYHVEFVSARSESYGSDSRKPTVREATIAEDVMRRDFTVNTLLADFEGNVYDLSGMALGDLERGILRTPLDPTRTFTDDPLRMMRAVRFAAQLEFEPAPGVLEAISPLCRRLTEVVSVERITEELRRLLLSQRPSIGLELMRRSGLLAVVIPELAECHGVEQGGYHTHDVYGHTLEAIDLAPRRLRVRLAVLFHDVGKPLTRTVEPDGRVRFTHHAERGGQMTRAALSRLRFPGDDVEAVTRLVEMHMRPVAYDGDWNDSAVRRLVHDADLLFEDLLEVAHADMRASAFPEPDRVLDLGQRAEKLGRDEVRRLVSPLDGQDLMDRFGRPAGPWIRRVKEALIDAVLEGELTADPEAAWTWLEAHPEVASEDGR
ncbi:MAG: CCA tRNA nucleotidyltransferase [Candidatus Dormibacteria bacterium]